MSIEKANYYSKSNNNNFSPCVLGMLWPVTDLHTDLFTAELLSSWIPSEASIPWSEVDKSNWILGSASENNSKCNF